MLIHCKLPCFRIWWGSTSVRKGSCLTVKQSVFWAICQPSCFQHFFGFFLLQVDLSSLKAAPGESWISWLSHIFIFWSVKCISLELFTKNSQNTGFGFTEPYLFPLRGICRFTLPERVRHKLWINQLISYPFVLVPRLMYCGKPIKNEEELCPNANDIKEMCKSKIYGVFSWEEGVLFSFLTDASHGNFLCWRLFIWLFDKVLISKFLLLEAWSKSDFLHPPQILPFKILAYSE